jgi:hypothetical protein
VKAPKSGSEFTGARGTLSLFIAGRSIELAAFDFECGAATGRVSLNDIALERTRRGYSFDTKAHGNVTYSDDQPDENASVAFRGRFTRGAKRVRGVYRVKSPRCGSTGAVEWRARR